MAKPIFGRGLAVRCERSEHGKSQLFKKYFCTILSIFLSNLSNCTEFSTLFNLISFASQSHCVSRIAYNGTAAWPLLCKMKKKSYFYFLKRKAEVNYRLGETLRSILRISLPSFPFEFSVEKASNRMIDSKGLIKVLKQIQRSFIVSFFKHKGMKKFDYYIGIDVSKLTLDVTILYECGNSTKTKYYKIENKEKSIAQFVKKKLAAYPPAEMLFCFEDTGIYSLPLAYYLNDNKFFYWQVPAIEIKRSKGIARGKDDKMDSKDIAFYAYSHMHKLRLSNMPSISIQQLRILFTEREKVLKCLSSLGKTSENQNFVSKEVFDTVAAINRRMIKQLKLA
ncbi:MAG: transposase, partial [Streptococcaceae bacterium]|nr:transposase [Streptococcaceae bacterium]